MAVRSKGKKKGETSLWTPRLEEKEREEVLQVLEHRFFCRPWKRSQWRIYPHHSL